MGEVVHLDASRHLPVVMKPEEYAALKVVQDWLDQTPDGDAYLTQHSMDTRKFDLVAAIVKPAASAREEA